MDARREAMTERLRARDAVRKPLNGSMKTEQVIDRFSVDFAHCKSRIEALLSLSDETDGVALDSSAHLDSLQAELKTAQKLVSDAQLYLSAYDKQVANRSLGNLVTAFNDRREKLAPKKKFAFRARKKEANTAASDDEPKAVSIDQVQTKVVIAAAADDFACNYRNLSSETLTERKADVVNGKDVSFQNLRDCQVRIYGSPSTVHISGLTDCTVLLGPVATSVFVEDCRHLTLAVACQQLRVHTTSESDFYIHVTSRSVIEDSTSLRFAPYTWRYDSIDEHYAMAGLDQRGFDRWNAVDDFDWLVAGKPSPNWSPMDEQDRMQLQ